MILKKGYRIRSGKRNPVKGEVFGTAVQIAREIEILPGG
jgi:hypothetical protein